MSFVKNKLKVARDALGKKDYHAARTAATHVLEYEPDNYNANVFLGLSLLELGQHEQSEQAYRTAIDLNQENPLAWQGISMFYERTENWEKHANILRRLMEIYNKINDAIKCAETWQRLVGLCRARDCGLQLADVLSLVLPQSVFHPILSTLSPPDSTNPTLTTTFLTQTAVYNSLPILEEIIELLEKQEEETMKKEVAKRRTRLGAAGPEVLMKEVGREIWSSSQIPFFYNEIINHPNTSDELRRLTESKLLRYKERYLHALPDTPEFSSQKAKILQELDDLVNGVVILGIPDELAWIIFLEGKDYASIVYLAAYDRTLMQNFIKLFPSSDMVSLLKGYFTYMDMPIFDEADESDERLEIGKEDAFDTILNAYPAVSNYIIANRVLAELYVTEMDYGNAVIIVENGLGLLKKYETNTSRKLPSVQREFKVTLATSLVHLFPPKHHPRALHLLDDILSQSPDNISCLMGRGYILQQAKKWREAAALFSRVGCLLPDDLNTGLRAKEENAWCLSQLNDLETGVANLHTIHEILKTLDHRSEDDARCLWRLGSCYWRMGGFKREEAYRYFIVSLKAKPTYAPAFTSLGIYYSEFSSPPDPKRASKCFQKAFELDSREAEAAKRLVEGFAEDGEWDLVEVVARRTIEGEGGLDAEIKGGTTAAVRYLPNNAWAWKAVGTVELNRRNYPSAIQAFQIALRAESDDPSSWLRLGEAYNKAGKHVAALKALERAHELQPNNWTCVYLIGDVKKGMGHFRDAIDTFESILGEHPSEVGVLVALGQAYLDQGRLELSEGFQSRAEQSFITCISVGLRILQNSPGFRGGAWKIIGDAIYALSDRSVFNEESSIHSTLQKLVVLSPQEPEDLADIIPRSSLLDSLPLNGMEVLKFAVMAYSSRISLDPSETAITLGSAWFDLGICLHMWATMSSNEEGNTRIRQRAITYLTRALREDPWNDVYWTGLGDAYFLFNARTAQHAYVKALEINSKNVATWTKLGLLCLHYEDIELANQAFFRAQTLDPDYAIAWIGQALVAVANSHESEATTMLEHAIGLTASVPDGDLVFALRSFSALRSLKYDKKKPLNALLPVFFVLARYCERRPEDTTALHLFGLVCEGLGHLETGVTLITRTITILESVYEDTEDPEVERRFTIANITLGRLRLSQRDYTGAAESFESALGLLVADDDPMTRALRTQALFGLGLAGYMQGDLEKALVQIEAAMETAHDDVALRSHVTVLLAQTMWAIRTDEFQEASKAQLLGCITVNPENLTAINALAGMGVLTDDDGLVDAALSEIMALPLDQRYELDPQRDVDYLLIQYYLGQQDLKKAISVAQSALRMEPSSIEARHRLATLMLQKGQFALARAIMSGLTNIGSLHVLPTSLSLQAITLALGSSKTALQKVQKAIVLSPWSVRHWQVLAIVRSKQGNEYNG